MGGNNLQEPRTEIGMPLRRAEVRIHLLGLFAVAVIVIGGRYFLAGVWQTPLTSALFFGVLVALIRFLCLTRGRSLYDPSWGSGRGHDGGAFDGIE